jgi:hypothetical protein
VNLNSILFTDFLSNEELANVLSLVALQLQNPSPFIIFDNCPITTEGMLEILQQFLHIQLRGQPLNQSQRFPFIPLLNPDVHFAASLRPGAMSV